MRSWSRARMSAVAIALLVSIAALGAPHAAEPGHEIEFSVFVVAHDASAHRIRPATDEPGHAVHCVACHWARSFRPAAVAAYTGEPVDSAEARRRTDNAPLPRRTSVSQPPLRSPPSLLQPRIHA